MDQLIKIHVGLDVHKDSITVAQALPGREPAKLVGKMVHDIAKLLKALAKLGSPEQLHVVYEAGPTGFGLQRALAKKGYVCEVIAPSKIPKQPGNRIKTDTRDAMELAQRSRVDGRLRPELARDRVEVDVVHAGAVVGLRKLIGELVEVGEVVHDADALAHTERVVARELRRAAPVLAGSQRLQVGVELGEGLHEFR